MCVLPVHYEINPVQDQLAASLPDWNQVQMLQREGRGCEYLLGLLVNQQPSSLQVTWKFQSMFNACLFLNTDLIRIIILIISFIKFDTYLSTLPSTLWLAALTLSSAPLISFCCWETEQTNTKLQWISEHQKQIMVIVTYAILII